MSELLNYLNSPHLVANFQKVFGIESQFDAASIDYKHTFATLTKSLNGDYAGSQKKNLPQKQQEPVNARTNANTVQTRSRSAINKSSGQHLNFNANGSVTTTSQTQTSTVTLTSKRVVLTDQEDANNELIEEKQQQQQQQQLKRTKKMVNITDDKNIIANTTIHIKFWYYFFRFGAAMGNEIFYCLFFPFWFWNVDGAIARKVGFLWGIYMTVGQATKDLLCMPRPASPHVVKLEERYLAEFGFPSTHAMVKIKRTNKIIEIGSV